jgi:hypothetical protein
VLGAGFPVSRDTRKLFCDLIRRTQESLQQKRRCVGSDSVEGYFEASSSFSDDIQWMHEEIQKLSSLMRTAHKVAESVMQISKSSPINTKRPMYQKIL